MYARVLNYLGLVSDMNTSHALQTDDLSHAATYLAIFKIADPKNPDCSYLAAEYYIKKGNAQQAVSSLNEAASLGYSDLAQLMTEPLFLPLHDDETFKKIATCVGVNTKTEK
jgi:Flp pilus assembly protein TadD